MPKMTPEQQFEYAVETEMIIEKLNLRRLQNMAEDAVLHAKELEERAKTNHKVRERDIRHAHSVAVFWVTRYRDEFERMYRVCADEEEEIVLNWEDPWLGFTEPEREQELVEKFTDQSDPPNPWDGIDDGLSPV